MLAHQKAISEDASMARPKKKLAYDADKIMKDLIENPSEDNLWAAVVAFQKYPFRTVSGLPFKYEIKKGKNGDYNKELIVDRRSESKSIVWSSVVLAFKKALEKQGKVVERPKALGDIRGISYIYPMLYRFGVIEAPEKNAIKMQLKGQ
jgi:hypothetical protein